MGQVAPLVYTLRLVNATAASNHHTDGAERFCYYGKNAVWYSKTGGEWLAVLQLQFYGLVNASMVYGFSFELVSMAKVWQHDVRKHLRRNDGAGIEQH